MCVYKFSKEKDSSPTSIQVKELEELGLDAIALHADTIDRAVAEGCDIYKEIKQGRWPVVFLSPERLVSPEFDQILRDKGFRANIMLIGLDELHVMVPWGKDFRKAYHSMAILPKRLPTHVPIIGTSATVTPGKDFAEICKLLALKPGSFYLLRLSNERRNVRSIVQELTHGLTGFTFPNIRWVVEPGRKVVVYCRTLDLGFRVAMYLWNTFPPGEHRLHRIRMWNSLATTRYNAETLELFRDNPETTTIIATVAFGMGMNVRNIQDVVNLGLPDTINALVQQDGRAGRDPAMRAQGHTYVEGATLSAVREVVAARKQPKAGTSEVKKPKGKAKAESVLQKAARLVRAKETVDKLDEGLCRLLEAHVEGRCLVAEKNRIYGNHQLRIPHSDKAALSCHDAERLLPCSSCEPLTPRPGVMTESPANSASEVSKPKRTKTFGPALPRAPLSKAEREYATSHLRTFARRRWHLKVDARHLHLPSDALWTGNALNKVLDTFHLLRSEAAVRGCLHLWAYLEDDGGALVQLLQSMNGRLDERHTKAKVRRNAKAKATCERNKAAKLAKLQSTSLSCYICLSS